MPLCVTHGKRAALLTAPWLKKLNSRVQETSLRSHKYILSNTFQNNVLNSVFFKSIWSVLRMSLSQKMNLRETLEASSRAPLGNRAVGLVVFRRSENGGLSYLLLQEAYGEKHWTPPKGYVEDSEAERPAALQQTLKETGLEAKDLQVIDDFSFKMQYAIRGQVKKIWYGLAEFVTGEKAKDNDKTKGNAKNIKVTGENHNAAWWLPINDAVRVSGYVEAEALLKKAEKTIQDKTKAAAAAAAPSAAAE